MQPHLRNTPKTYDFRNFLCKDLSDFVENYRKYTTKTQNQPSEQNLGKKIFRKNLSGATHPYGKLQERGYGTDLQVITHVYLPRFSTFVNKINSFLRQSNFEIFTNKFEIFTSKISLQMTSTKIS